MTEHWIVPADAEHQLGGAAADINNQQALASVGARCALERKRGLTLAGDHAKGNTRFSQLFD